MTMHPSSIANTKGSLLDSSLFLRHALSVIACVLVSGAWTPSTYAVPIIYQVDLTVTGRSFTDPAVPTGGGSFQPFPEISDSFTAVKFSIDDSELAVDGNNLLLPLLSFRAEIGGVVWDPNDPTSAFDGFRDSTGLIFSPSMNFDVLGSDIVALAGGVFGVADFPNLGFEISGVLPGQFVAGDIDMNFIDGTYVVSRMQMTVPEPAGVVLVLSGMAALYFGRRRLCRRGGQTASTSQSLVRLCQ